MKISIDDNKIKQEIAFTDASDLLYTIKRSIDFLESHNKNYNRNQYTNILMLQSFIRCIDIQED